MPERPTRFDAASVRRAWDEAADAYAQGQASGHDYYRYEFFGPAQAATCGDVSGRRLLDVGCGNGYFAREMARRGARVTGLDISPRMIEHARRQEAAAPLGIAYRVGDAAAIAEQFAGASFELATSCVALQDMPDVPRVLHGVRSVLQPGGRFIASITHPCSDTPYRAWARDETGRKRWLCIDLYFDRGPITYMWRGWGYDFTTAAMHAPLEDWFDWILGAGFQLLALREPCPSEAALRARPDLEDAARVPYYLIFDLVCTQQALDFAYGMLCLLFMARNVTAPRAQPLRVSNNHRYLFAEEQKRPWRPPSVAGLARHLSIDAAS